jgi:hypothetical protein
MIGVDLFHDDSQIRFVRLKPCTRGISRSRKMPSNFSVSTRAAAVSLLLTGHAIGEPRHLYTLFPIVHSNLNITGRPQCPENKTGFQESDIE